MPKQAKPHPRIPSNAKCVFKGVLFEVWQWEQTMFGGSTRTFEKVKQPDCAVTIPVVGNHILVLRQLQPGWSQSLQSLAGGRVDAGEDPLTTAKREMLEESGYVSDDWLPWREYEYKGKILRTSFTFIARNCRKVREGTDDHGEKFSQRLVSFDEFLLLSDDLNFYEIEIVPDLLRIRLDSKKREEFRKLLWPNE